MNIDLNVTSPTVETPGLDAAIAKLREMQGIVRELRDQPKIQIQVGTVGGMDKAAAQVKELSVFQKSLNYRGTVLL